MDQIEHDPNVMNITDTEGFLEVLIEKNKVLEKIAVGLDKYVDKKRKVFPR